MSDGKTLTIHWEKKQIKLYLCNHNLNTTCKKTSCFYLNKGECKRTTFEKFKLDDSYV